MLRKGAREDMVAVVHDLAKVPDILDSVLLGIALVLVEQDEDPGTSSPKPEPDLALFGEPSLSWYMAGAAVHRLAEPVERCESLKRRLFLRRRGGGDGDDPQAREGKGR
ncbi:MAG TPA: hypothetical protein VJ397_06785, partial [Thermoplasmata archaeon]|nr:hypothetical protein [Thermoplasmata archaeon]